jgi:transposase
MIKPRKSKPAYLYSGIVDMRKSIDSLQVLIKTGENSIL